MRKQVRAEPPKRNKSYEPSSSHILSLTFEARAVVEVHVLHALGEHDLVDSTCGREGEGRKEDKMRNEESRARKSESSVKLSSSTRTCYLHCDDVTVGVVPSG